MSKLTPIQLYAAKNAWMDQYYTRVSALDFYSSIFPLSELEICGDHSSHGSNPVIAYKVTDSNGRAYFRNEILFQDSFANGIARSARNPMALCGMCTYSGRTRTAQHAYQCHGFCIDLDGVGIDELTAFWGWVEHLEKIPYPTYVVNSGNGLHIYYVFENPVPLYPAVRGHLQRLKRGLTNWVWNRETSSYGPAKRQYQGIYQSYRMVGSRTKLGDGKAKDRYLVTAWRTGRPVTISQLNGYVEADYRCPTTPDYSSWDWADSGPHYSLDQCKELFPEWYDRRIVRGIEPSQYVCSKGLYDWWYRQICKGAIDGNRYHCVSMLYVYGRKCGLPKDLVDEDAMGLIPVLDGLTVRPQNRFTADDVIQASKYYSMPRVFMTTRAEVERRTGIPIPTIRRNHRSQAEHLTRARLLRSLSSYEHVGRPASAKALVLAYRRSHPDGTKLDCIRETGVSRASVFRHWKKD